MEEYTSTTFNWPKFKEGKKMIGGDIMIGSNEGDWRHYQQEPSKKTMLRNGVGLMPGIDPEESFNFCRAFTLTIACTLAMIGILVWAWLC